MTKRQQIVHTLSRHFTRGDIQGATDELLALLDVSQQRELLIGLLTKLENGGGSAFIDKEQIVDDYLKANL